MSMDFYVNGRLILQVSDCKYSADCPAVQYIKREKFLCNISEPSKDHITINVTVFNTDTVAKNLWKIHTTHKELSAQQQMFRGK